MIRLQLKGLGFIPSSLAAWLLCGATLACAQSWTVQTLSTRTLAGGQPVSGKPIDAAVGSPEYFRTLGTQFIYAALERQAIAPQWEADTARLQSAAGDPQAGLTEEERAGRNGLLATLVTADSQLWRPVALDLNGNGIQTTGELRGVAFDVDDSGYLKNTAWLSGGDGFLYLDRNLNGGLDSARELFSNGLLDLSARGLAGMRWVDSNYDGSLTAADPVWDELKVWIDANGDGQAQAGETQGLSALGITSLNYAMGTFEQNGVLKQLGSPDLAADSQGIRTHVVAEGIVVETSAGQVSLLATRIDDKSLLEANRDGVTGYEDMVTINLFKHYQNNSCLCIFDKGKGTFSFAKILGNAVNQAQWGQVA